eukprot:gnl/TRDRNA2_/TRDRNA2_60499_c0_seq1.p1 gnl/TRDRNA2_/TRDRNA2_60499_c0~~gnl/TRDRNA2_/TRDRNA2_60499_c0_seq1.p1  ORF type:complete len:401 (-),score=19.76 gnl/TRDRNA2_/TRDRNA2_60499_c0_seq1:8-1210(-)
MPAISPARQVLRSVLTSKPWPGLHSSDVSETLRWRCEDLIGAVPEGILALDHCLAAVAATLGTESLKLKARRRNQVHVEALRKQGLIPRTGPLALAAQLRVQGFVSESEDLAWKSYMLEKLRGFVLGWVNRAIREMIEHARTAELEHWRAHCQHGDARDCKCTKVTHPGKDKPSISCDLQHEPFFQKLALLRSAGRIDAVIPELQRPRAGNAVHPLRDALENGPWHEVVEAYLGKGARLTYVSAIVAHSRQSCARMRKEWGAVPSTLLSGLDGHQDWHQDSPRASLDPAVLESLVDGQSYGVAVILPLVDVDSVTGPTQIWRKSHRLRLDEMEIDHIPEREIVSATTRAGWAYMYDFHTAHRGSVNRGPTSRPVLQLNYVIGDNLDSFWQNYGTAPVVFE